MRLIRRLFHKSKPARPSLIKDYSEKRDAALKRLGDEYLLAKPIRRRSSVKWG